MSHKKGTTAILTDILTGQREMLELFSNKIENSGLVAYWNDEKLRDEKAVKFRSYKNGRFDIDKKTLECPNGKYFCCYTEAGMKAKKLDLDESED